MTVIIIVFKILILNGVKPHTSRISWVNSHSSILCVNVVEDDAKNLSQICRIIVYLAALYLM